MSKMSREDLLKLLAKCSPRTRKTVIRVVDGRMSQDDAAFVQEQVSFIEPDMTVRTVDFISSRLCDAGHAIDQQNRLVGQCSICKAYVCSQCQAATCGRCGLLVCGAHARVYGEGEAYCSRCHPLALLRWLVLGERRRGDGRRDMEKGGR
jgi:hypothetical protein